MKKHTCQAYLFLVKMHIDFKIQLHSAAVKELNVIREVLGAGFWGQQCCKLLKIEMAVLYT